MSLESFTVTYFIYGFSLLTKAWQKTMKNQLRPIKGEFIHFSHLNIIVEVQQTERDLHTGEHFAFCVILSGKECKSDENPQIFEKDNWEMKEVPKKFLMTNHHR